MHEPQLSGERNCVLRRRPIRTDKRVVRIQFGKRTKDPSLAGPEWYASRFAFHASIVLPLREAGVKVDKCMTRTTGVLFWKKWLRTAHFDMSKLNVDQLNAKQAAILGRAIKDPELIQALFRARPRGHA
jgi:hypothetical protein